MFENILKKQVKNSSKPKIINFHQFFIGFWNFLFTLGKFPPNLVNFCQFFHRFGKFCKQVFLQCNITFVLSKITLKKSWIILLNNHKFAKFENFLQIEFRQFFLSVVFQYFVKARHKHDFFILFPNSPKMLFLHWILAFFC